MLLIGPKSALFFAFTVVSTVALAQDGALTLERSLELAKERNGTVRAAFLAKESAKSRTKQSLAAFFPTVTPSYEFLASRTDRQTGAFRGITESDTHTSDISARWQLLDSGERQWSLSANRLSERAQNFATLQTLRQVLSQVHQQYYDTLRTQELVRVAQEQVNLADNILKQTRALVETGESAEKDILQAEADYLNAKVQLLVAGNQKSTAEAALKAIIGWNPSDPLPSLTRYADPAEWNPGELETVVKSGLEGRADLQAERLRTDADRYSVLRANQDALYNWSLDANYRHQFSEDVVDSQALSFVVSLPLFDAGATREAARQARLAWQANQASLVQAERDARSEIEAAYAQLVQNNERVAAAKAAVEAARKNYEAAEGSRTAGASDLIQVLTARVSLSTAESNYVEAIYDTYVAEVRLRLAIGLEIPGEK